MCPRFNSCQLRNINGNGCEKGEYEDCDLFILIQEKLQVFGKEIEKNLNSRGVFSYKEPWYIEARKDLLSGGFLVSEKEFKKIEDGVVEDFLKTKKE